MDRRSAWGHRPALKCLAAAALALLAALPARAYPIFARKYETSCQTCHAIFPKLNPFGQAFRLNGYRMPKETEELVKVKQNSLGSDGYKKLWPNAIWPSELPSAAPVAVNIKFMDVNQTTDDHQGGKQVTNNDFQFPSEANLFGAGTLGEHLGVMVELTWSNNPDTSAATEIEHARLDFDNLLGPEHACNLRIGKFAPNLYDGFQEMWIQTDNGIDALFSYNPVGLHGGNSLDDGTAGVVALPDRVRGVEAYGVLAHRMLWVVGISSKNGPGQQDLTPGANSGSPASTAPSATGNFGNSASKDFYARLDWKFGGMGLDGDTEGVTLPAENWRETSFRIGLLAMFGDGKNIWTPLTMDSGAPGLMQDTGYSRVGLFASLYLSDLNLFGTAIHGRDNLQLWDSTATVNLGTTPRTYDAWFLQADYQFTPCFMLSGRYEKLRMADASAEPKGIRWTDLCFSYAVAANVKLQLEARKDYNTVLPTNSMLNAICRLAF